MTSSTENNSGMTLPGWQPRRYKSGDELELADLFSTVFKRRVTHEWWLWKMRGETEAAANVWVGVSGAGRIMAQYAGIPVQIKLDGVIQEAIISVDTMTAPDFRKRGVLTTLGQLAYDSWTSQGKAAILGLPNQQWGSRTTALGWESMFPLAWLRFPLHIEKVVARSQRIPGAARPLAAVTSIIASSALHRLKKPRLTKGSWGISVDRLNDDLTQIDSLWSQLSPHYRNTLVRNSAWVKWRFVDAVNANYRVLFACRKQELIGYLVYRLVGAGEHLTGLIADLFVAPRDTLGASALIACALDEMWKAEVVTARTTASPGSSAHNLFVAAGFTPMEAAFGFDLVRLDHELNAESLADAKGWHLAGGDFDIV